MREIGKGDASIVIEKTPMRSFPHGRENCFAAKSMNEIERIIAERGKLASTRHVPVAEYGV